MWSLYILVIAFVVVYLLAYIFKCILDYKKLKEIEEEECRTPSPVTECFPLEEVVTSREMAEPISSPPAPSAEQPKVHDAEPPIDQEIRVLDKEGGESKESTT